MIVIKNLRVEEFGEPLFEKVDLVIRPDERTVVVGSAASVTTFLRVLAGEVEADAGTIQAGDARLLYVSVESLHGDPAALTQVYRTRPTFLLIDARSSGVSDASELLRQLIKNFRGGILLATTDESLIHAAGTTRVLELNASLKTITSYSGTHEAYVVERKKRDAQLHEAYEKQQREKLRLEMWLEQKRKEATINRSPENGATIRAKTKYLKREILDKELPNPNQDGPSDR